MINELITYLTFIPWILVFIKNSLDILNSKDNITFKYLRKNFFKIFRLDLLILIIVFFYFATFDKGFVHKYLFAIINLYLFVNSFYENKKALTKDLFKKKYLSIIITFVLMLIPIIYYIFKQNVIITYKIMFIYIYFESILILLIKKKISK